MKDLTVEKRETGWLLTATLDDDSTEEFSWGLDVPLAQAAAETRALVALKEAPRAGRARHRIADLSRAQLAALETTLKAQR